MQAAKSMPEPKDEADRRLQSFATIANQSNLHDTDWDRFYRFVVSAFEGEKVWDSEDVREQLVGYGITRDLAKDLSRVYKHALLTLKTKSLMEFRIEKVARLTGPTL
jgi:hypothetical protein